MASTSHHQPTFVHHQCISTFTGHTSHISSLTISRGFLYTGSSNKEIRIFPLNYLQDTTIDNNSLILKAGKGAVKSVLISGSKLFTAHQDHKIRVFEITTTQETQTFKLITTLPTLTDRVLRFFPPKNHVQIRRHKKCTWVHHVDTISALALSTDHSVLYSVSWDRTLKIWQTSDFRCLESITNAHDDAINALAVSNTGLVFTGSADKNIKVWRKVDEGGKKKKRMKHSLMATLEKHKSAVNALVISADGSSLYSGGSDCAVLVWEKSTNDPLMNYMDVASELKGHKKPILCLGAVSDLVCSGSADNTARIWRRHSRDRSIYSCLAVLEGHGGPVKCLSAAVDHHQSSKNSSLSSSYLVCTGSLDCDIKVWKVLVPLDC